MLQELENEIWSYDQAHFEEVWLCKEGKSTKEFLHLEDLRLRKQDINSLKDSTNKLVSDVDEVLTVIRSFYENLYSNVNEKALPDLQ